MPDVERLVGSVLSDRYEILDKIGSGGMAIVYKAHDRVLDRDVAIKLLRDSYESGSKVIENFIKEARSSASLVHPNVVSVYDVCEIDGINYMVMELVDGYTLKDYIKSHPRMPWQEACGYAIQIAQGIRAAHEQGIIHRDIKPQNIMIAPDGSLKVTDFGIAKAIEGDKSIVGGTAMGSVHYISPEQAKGGFTDFRSDIYSLGIVLYEMLAGRVPFDGDTPVSVALMHIESEPLSVKCVNIDVPADLDYITMKAMNRESGKRYQTMSEMIDDLRAVLAEESLPSREPVKGEDDVTGKEGTDNAESISDPDKAPDANGRTKRLKEAEKEKKKRKRAERNAVILALSTLAALALIIAGCLMIFTHPFSKTVPELVGMTVDEAREAAAQGGYILSSEVEYAVSDSVPEDRIISQFPEANTESPRNEPIKVVVSLGASGGSIEVPDVSGMNLEEAAAAIEAASLQYRLVTAYSDTVELGFVIRQTPVAGTHLNASDIVTVYYSLGEDLTGDIAQSVTVPSVLGLTLEGAEHALEGIGLNVGSVSKKESQRAEGTIINQSPSANTSVKAGTAVSLVISSGVAAATNNEPLIPNAETASAAPAPEQLNTVTGNVYKVKIPSDIQNDTISVQIIANGTTVHNAVHSKSEGQIAVEIPFEGSVSIQAYIDGAKISDKTVTF